MMLLNRGPFSHRVGTFDKGKEPTLTLFVTEGKLLFLLHPRVSRGRAGRSNVVKPDCSFDHWNPSLGGKVERKPIKELSILRAFSDLHNTVIKNSFSTETSSRADEKGNL